jgi:hypothetical protein
MGHDWEGKKKKNFVLWRIKKIKKNGGPDTRRGGRKPWEV